MALATTRMFGIVEEGTLQVLSAIGFGHLVAVAQDAHAVEADWLAIS